MTLKLRLMSASLALGLAGSAAAPTGGYLVPPVAGKHSFNDGAGMARTSSAGAFVKPNMPLGQGCTLSDQDGLDVAEYFTHLPRPVYKFKAKDWPKGDKPKDARS